MKFVFCLMVIAFATLVECQFDQAMFCYNRASQGQTCPEVDRLHRSGAGCREVMKEQVACYKNIFSGNCNRDHKSFWPSVCKKLINLPGANSNKECYDYAIGLCDGN
uniref:Uncharacterized protein n=1 Tax=Acrobeloides nanus TaxID=290746 RepID=A0A914C0G8_9BILA